MFVLLALALAASGVVAQTAGLVPFGGTLVPGPPTAVCTRTLYNVTVPAYTVMPFASTISTTPNQTVITAQFQEYVASPTNFTAMYESPTNGSTTMPATTYQISGTLCEPIAGYAYEGVVQLLVHGISFDSAYWDFPYEPATYSYVWAAAAYGYATFRYDKLGTGLSEYPADGYRVVQGDTDLAILSQITTMLREGTISGIPFSKIVAIGHSYGSLQVEALAAHYPTAADATILTGFSDYGGFVPLFLASGLWSSAAQVDPYRFSDVPSTYLLPGLPQALQLNFYYFPYYDPSVFALAAETDQPITTGVMFTIESLGAVAYNYTYPVLVVTGAQDWPFCGGNCYASQDGNLTILESVQPLLFPRTNVTVFAPENTGHNLNLHYSAPQTYVEMLRWIDSLAL